MNSSDFKKKYLANALTTLGVKDAPPGIRPLPETKTTTTQTEAIDAIRWMLDVVAAQYKDAKPEDKVKARSRVFAFIGQVRIDERIAAVTQITSWLREEDMGEIASAIEQGVPLGVRPTT